MRMTATYSPEDNKLRMYASQRVDDETYQALRHTGFVYAPRQKLFVAPSWTPRAEDLLIDLCGQIDDEDSTLSERAEERAEKFAEFSGKRSSEAESAQASSSAIAGRIPFGQPILVGHHSEGRARRDAQRIDDGMRRAVRLWDTSQYWLNRAAAAVNHAAYKQRPDVRARRIKGIEADLRKQERNIQQARETIDALSVPNLTYEQVIVIANSAGSFSLWGHLQRDNAPHYLEVCASFAGSLERTIAYCDRWANHYKNRIAYERALLAEQGGLPADNFDIVAGGEVLIGGEWLTVRRVTKRDGQAVSVTVNRQFVPVRKIEEIKDYRAPSQEQAETAEAATKLATMCNYPGPDFLHITKAEWEAKNPDCRGSRELGQDSKRAKGYRPDIQPAIVAQCLQSSRHRVRVMVSGKLQPVYITDSKRIDPPAVPSAPSATTEAAPADEAAKQETLTALFLE